MKEHYVSYSQAVALKRLGFKERCNAFYWTSDREFEEQNRIIHANSNHCTTVVMAPKLDQAAAWMREHWGIHISVNPHLDYSDDADGRRCDEWHFWAFELMNVESGRVIDDSDVEYESYEEALSAGISAFLESLEEEIRANEFLGKEVKE